MKVLIFGATGPTGRCLSTEALAHGYEVTAFVRALQVLQEGDRLTILTGNVLDAPQVEESIRGQDAVLCALGGSTTPERPNPTPVRFPGTKNIVDGMGRAGVKRLICLSAYGVGNSRNRGGLFAMLAWLTLRKGLEDTEQQERVIQDSNLDWTIVRASRLTNAPAKGAYQVGMDLRLGVTAKIARVDVAEFMVKRLKLNDYIHQIPEISY
jgi:putative NADH-flavin reductase